MIKGILMILVLFFSGKIIYKGLSGNVDGPYTTNIELLWKGEYCGQFGKLIVIGVPLILLIIINKIF